MTFSLLNVTATNPDGTVDGSWIQDHIGSYEGALERAAKTSEANSNRIHVAVVEKIDHPTPMLGYWTGIRIAKSVDD